MKWLLPIVLLLGLLGYRANSQVPGIATTLGLATLISGPVAFVNTATNTSHLSSGSYTSDSLTISGTGCTFLVAWLQGTRSGGAPSAFTGTYNGVSMTVVAGFPAGPDATFNQEYVTALTLSNPASGSNTLAVNWTGTMNRDTLSAQCFSGAVGTVSGIVSSTSGANLGVSSTTVDLVVGTAQSISNGGGISLTASGGTQDWNNIVGGPVNVSNSGAHVPGASSVSFTWSGTKELTAAFSIH